MVSPTPSSTPSSYLTPTQRYAAGALFGLALHQAQLHQTHPLGLSTDEYPSSSSSSSRAVFEDPDLWVHHTSGLLRPIFIFLDIDSGAWSGLEETSGSSLASSHVGPFLRLLSEEFDNDNSQRLNQELALSEAVEAMVLSLEKNSESSRSKREKLREYEHQCREKFSTADVQPNSEKVDTHLETQQEEDTLFFECEDPQGSSNSNTDEGPVEEVMMLSYQRKMTVLYQLLAACLSDIGEKNTKYTRRRKGYDARHRVALRLLATWLDIKWTKMEAIEMIVSSSAMAILKEQMSNKETQSKESSWAKWKRGGIIGAAALTGGTLMAITGGLAAPAIAAGLGALAPTLGTLIPVIGAGGFAAAASAAGTVVGSVAVAASFGAAGAGLTGTKMARRVGSVDEFEFRAIGANHNQGILGVEILVSGFVFEEDDFVRPWEGQNDNLERYALQWESKNLMAVSTAIQDCSTSTELMEKVVLLGAPIAIKDVNWEAARKNVQLWLWLSYDQVVHDVELQKLPVRFAMDRAGLVGSDGPTHSGTFDVTFMACLPNMVVMAPSDEAELCHMVPLQQPLMIDPVVSDTRGEMALVLNSQMITNAFLLRDQKSHYFKRTKHIFNLITNDGPTVREVAKGVTKRIGGPMHELAAKVDEYARAATLAREVLHLLRLYMGTLVFLA